MEIPMITQIQNQQQNQETLVKDPEYDLALAEVSEDFEDPEELCIEEIEALPHEKCDCSVAWRIMWDTTNDKVYFVCYGEQCESYFITKQEFDSEREKV